MRSLLIIAYLLPLVAVAQLTLDNVQSDLGVLLKPGQQHPHVDVSEPFNDLWSRIFVHDSVGCDDDLCSKGRYGLVNRENGDTLYAAFHDITLFSDRIFLSCDSWACLTDVNLKVTHVYRRAHMLSRHFIAASDGNHYGVLDTLMQQVIPPKYDSIRQVIDLLVPHNDTTPDFIVKEHGKWGVVNYRGGVKIKLSYEALIELDGFAAFAGKKGKYGFLRWDGAPVTHFIYDSMYNDWSSPNFIVTRDKKIGLMDEVGNEVVKPSFSEVTRASANGCRCAKLNGKYAVISGSGVNLSGFIYDGFRPYLVVHDEMALQKNGKWGFFGCRSKKEISPFVYDDVAAFYGYEADMMQDHVKKKIRLRDE